VQGKSKRFPPEITGRAIRKLEYLNLATGLDDLKAPLSNRLHELERERIGQFSISVHVKAFSAIERSARLKLDRMEAAAALQDLAALLGDRFEALVGDRKGQYSIRISSQWRICFEWPEGAPGPSSVEIVDYH
jgi:toxin HigB-1